MPTNPARGVLHVRQEAAEDDTQEPPHGEDARVVNLPRVVRARLDHDPLHMVRVRRHRVGGVHIRRASVPGCVRDCFFAPVDFGGQRVDHLLPQDQRQGASENHRFRHSLRDYVARDSDVLLPVRRQREHAALLSERVRVHTAHLEAVRPRLVSQRVHDHG